MFCKTDELFCFFSPFSLNIFIFSLKKQNKKKNKQNRIAQYTL